PIIFSFQNYRNHLENLRAFSYWGSHHWIGSGDGARTSPSTSASRQYANRSSSKSRCVAENEANGRHSRISSMLCSAFSRRSCSVPRPPPLSSNAAYISKIAARSSSKAASVRLSFPFLCLQHVRWQPMSTGHSPSQSGDTTIATNSPSQSSGSITSAGGSAGSAAGDTAVASSARCMPLLMAVALEWVGISLSLPSLLSFANENSALAGDGSGDGCPLLSPPNP